MKKNEKLKYALVGCGRIAVNHISAILNNKDIDLVALCDINLKQADILVEKMSLDLGKINLYSSHKDLLKKEKLDLVGIATESGSHAKIAIDCLKDRVNVIVEKPMALSVKDANKMIEMAKKNKVKLCVSHQNRFNKPILKLREAVESGKFGKMHYGVANIRWNRNKDYYKQADWRGTWEHDGGALMNQCIHNIDLLLWMMNSEVKQVCAYTANFNHPFIEGEDSGLAIIKFKNGTFGMIEGTVSIYPENLEETLSLFGEKGTVRIGGKSLNKIDVWNFEDIDKNVDSCDEEPPNVYGFGHNELYKDMVKAIRKNKKPCISGSEGKKALELILAIYKSAKSNKGINLPLKNFFTRDMIGFRFSK